MLHSHHTTISDFQKYQELLIRLSEAETKLFTQAIELKYLRMQLDMHKKFAEIDAKYAS